MLEVKHLTKIYRNKKGVDVKALDDISVTFPETGMVFLIGKSGSGKSTLLNVCGGLDIPTSGEIIVKGRSSRDFTQSDFDSYRNTFVGFIFQEYNILHEFTVEENIALALELQGKSGNKKAVEDLLEKVDLVGYGRRKPNTLSGGQKQRIAIARALIKNPEIIMADEPTGALDSITGKQVLETLKKLSKDTLVIVVSHDHEFAETYGDRIIELKDGKIISDETKVTEKTNALSTNVSTVGNVLCIKNGSSLNDKDFAGIKEFILKSKEDVIIASEKEEVDKFKKISRIRSDGSKEVFDKTDSKKIVLKEYKEEDRRFIRSRLPQKHAFRIGMSGMKAKPIRLIFTILLCTIAFIFFGLLSTMTFYDSERTFKQSLRDTDVDYMQLGKNYYQDTTYYFQGEASDTMNYLEKTRFTPDEVKFYQDKLGDDVFPSVDVMMELKVQKASAGYWVNAIEHFATINDNHILAKDIIGKLPQTDDEIVLSSYMVDVIINCKAYDDKGEVINIKKHEDIIGKKVSIGYTTYKIVGVFDSGVLPEKYDAIKDGTYRDDALLTDYRLLLSDGLHLVALVSEERLIASSFENTFSNVSGDFSATVMVKKSDEGIYEDYSTHGYEGISYIKDSEIDWFKEESALEDDEILASRELLASLMIEEYQKDNAESKYEDVRDKLTKAYALKNNSENKLDAKGEAVEEILTVSQAEKYLEELTEDARQAKLKITVKLFSTEELIAVGNEKTYTVVGVWDSGFTKMYDVERLIVSDKEREKLIEEHSQFDDFMYVTSSSYNKTKDEYYDKIYIPFDKTEKEIEELYKLYVNTKANEEQVVYQLTGTFVSTLRSVDIIINEFSSLFFWTGLVLAVFAIMLFANFIAVSIAQKTKDIGILRAVGAKGSDVFKIFYSESFVIGAICFALSSVLTIWISAVFNNIVAAEIGVSLLVFGLPSFVILLLIAIVTSILATFVPVLKASRKKPVDCIRG